MLRTAALSLSLTLCGCSSGMVNYVNREIQENEISVGDEHLVKRHRALQASVLGMSENRRGILIRDNVRLADGTPSLYFCAEPPPDVATSTRSITHRRV